MSPDLHATLVGIAAVSALISAGVCLAQSPRTESVRVHAVYGCTAAWWLFSFAMVAGAETPSRVDFWVRSAQLSIGMLPAVVYHVNVVVAGLGHELRRAINLHYAIAVAVTVFCLASPDLLAAPFSYSWGAYPAYTAWGAIPLGALLFVFAEVIWMYRSLLRRYEPGTAEHARARAFHYGNCFAFLAAVDFLPALGVPVYPLGFFFISTMFTATMFGAYRYRLIEITPEIAAERILETMPDGVMVVDTRGMVRLANGAAARLLARRMDDLVHQPLESIAPDVALVQALETAQAGQPATEVQFSSADGSLRRVAIAGARVQDPSGHLVARVWLLHDLTEQRHAEEERNRLEGWIRQTQKMESLGAMAGGIAHDFNNILMAILGSAEVAKRKLASGAPVNDELHTISTAAAQAAELTDQLLTYAGRSTSLSTTVNLSALSREMADLMRSAISRKAKLDLALTEPLPLIQADRSQIRQVILNLVANASDALGDRSGTITVRTGLLEPGPAGQPTAPSSGETRPPGRRVLLEVSDTGGGMDRETKTKIFDPFFTTKFAGRGLGLAIVLRIVQEHGGVIGVTSAQGAGARFSVDFPALDAPALTAAGTAVTSPAWTGSGVVLLADDEALVRRVLRKILIGIGFEVVEATNGAEAVTIFRDRPNDFALAVLDVTMPGMNGHEVADEMRRLRPSVPVVLMSGYTDVEGIESAGGARTVFLHKPFKPATLSEKVNEAMGTA